ncbi:MAG: sigma-70 family RNA polymerase sigma factor [Candidatus Marinimicrobia bacterium]|nr:sigma-70 family RNA polymerase sigma factor [Candidatus Neomarinimicrobiota bacterium]
MDDGELLAAYRLGDETALAELVARCRRPLYGFIMKMCAYHEQEAEDLFQEVWLRALRHLPRFKQGSFLSWLFRIAHNLVIDQARRRKEVLSLNAPLGASGLTLSDQVAADEPAPDQQAAARELGARIRVAVAGLPVNQREVFLLRTEAELPFKEIARIQRTTLNTALGRMHYAVTRLRAVLRTDYDLLTGGTS